MTRYCCETGTRAWPDPCPRHDTPVQIALAWHDVACPEGFDCRDRVPHSMAQPLVTTGMLAAFLERLAELRAEQRLNLREHRLGSIARHLHSLSDHDQREIRRALIQRVANRLAVIQAVWSGRGALPEDCCTVGYTNEQGHRYAVFFCDETCDHWHHREEVWIA